MTTPSPLRRKLIRISIIVSTPFCLLAGCIALDAIPLSRARPPKSLQTIEDFQAWKGPAIMGKGVYEHSGVTYIVMLGPAGRYWASGPSAYVFDGQGRFVDWTSDMGDFYTVRHHFDLTSGHVRNIKHERP